MRRRRRFDPRRSRRVGRADAQHSTAGKGRSTCCSTWRGRRRSTSPQISILAAGRAISRLPRRGAGAEARDRRRLSRDGGVAGLPQILPAAAQGSRGRPEPRGNRAAAADAAPAARRDARGRRAAAGPRPHRPRRVRARRARRAAAGAQVGLAGARFRPVRGLWRGHARATAAGDARRPRRAR